MFGMDMMTVLTAAARSKQGTEEYHQEPSVPSRHVPLACLQLIRKFNKAGIGIIPVFDGISRHPYKQQGAGEQRSNTAAKALAKLENLLKKP